MSVKTKSWKLRFNFRKEVDNDYLKVLISKLLPITLSSNDRGMIRIEDFYISADTYLTKINGVTLITTPIENEEISTNVYSMLSNRSKLFVSKTKEIFILDEICSAYIVEYIEPMQLKSIEITFYKESSLIEFRENVKENAPFLIENPKNDYEYFKRKIALAGAASSGKTCSARSLANLLNIEFGANVEHCAEYVRTFIYRYGVPDWEMQPYVTQGTDRREKDLVGRHHIIISDGPKFLSYVYTQMLFDGELDTRNIYILSKIYKNALLYATEYDDVVLLYPQKLKEDGCRYQDANDTRKTFEMVHDFLKNHNIPFIEHDVVVNSDEELIEKLFFLNNVLLTKEQK